jgi:hypothetical protein
MFELCGTNKTSSYVKEEGEAFISLGHLRVLPSEL